MRTGIRQPLTEAVGCVASHFVLKRSLSLPQALSERRNAALYSRLDSPVMNTTLSIYLRRERCCSISVACKICRLSQRPWILLCGFGGTSGMSGSGGWLFITRLHRGSVAMPNWAGS